MISDPESERAIIRNRYRAGCADVFGCVLTLAVVVAMLLGMAGGIVYLIGRT